VIEILKTILEVKKLKVCLLSKEQRLLFESLPKPVLDLKPENNGVFSYEDKINLNDRSEVQKAYRNISS